MHVLQYFVITCTITCSMNKGNLFLRTDEDDDNEDNNDNDADDDDDDDELR